LLLSLLSPWFVSSPTMLGGNAEAFIMPTEKSAEEQPSNGIQRFY